MSSHESRHTRIGWNSTYTTQDQTSWSGHHEQFNDTNIAIVRTTHLLWRHQQPILICGLTSVRFDAVDLRAWGGMRCANDEENVAINLNQMVEQQNRRGGAVALNTCSRRLGREKHVGSFALSRPCRAS